MIFRLIGFLFWFAPFIMCGYSYAGDLHTLENRRLRADIDPEGCVITITDKSNGAIYRTDKLGSLKFGGEYCSTDTCVFHYRVFHGDYDIAVTITLCEETLVFSLHADPYQEMKNSVRFPGVIRSHANDYYVIPYASGIISSVKEPYPLGWPEGSYYMWGYKSTMPFSGVTDLEKGYMITSDDPWDTEIAVVRPDHYNPFYTLQLNHHPSKETFGYDRTFYYTFFDNGGYVGMCRWYRKHAEKKGYVRTFREKAVSNQHVNRLQGAVDFWAFGAFRNTAFIDELMNFGFDRVEIVFAMNWNNPESMPDLINYINRNGYLSSRYDCFTDVYPPTYPDNPWFRTTGYPEDVIVNRDGSLCKGWVTYLDENTPFQGYITCSATHEAYARSKLMKELFTDRYNGRFIDVEMAYELRECYSPQHPTTRHEDALYRIQAMKIVKEMLNLVTGTEEARDFAFPYTDYSMGTMTIAAPEGAGYDWSVPTYEPGDRFIRYGMNPAFRVPLHGLVYHDVHVATWYTGDGVSKTPDFWDDKDLFTILYGTMQVFLPMNRFHWVMNRDKFVTSYHLTSSVFRRVGFEQMAEHEFLTDDKTVQKTVFSNGWTVVANFGPYDYYTDGNTIPPKGFYAGDGIEKVYRIANGQDTLAVAKLADRLFINPYGVEAVFGGIRTSGSVFLGKHDDHIHLAIVGDIEHIDINPALLPWPLGAICVKNKDKEKIIELETLDGGWLRLKKPLGVRFFRIEWDESTEVEDISGTLPKIPELHIHPNPFNSETRLSYTIFRKSRVKIELYNILGQRVKLLADSFHEQGKYSITLDSGDLNSGLYMCRLRANDITVTGKIMLVK